MPGVTPPPVLGWAVEDGAAVLCLGALAAGRPARSGGVPVSAMHALPTRNGPLRRTPFGQPARPAAAAEAEALADVTPGRRLDRGAPQPARGAARPTQPWSGAAWHGDWVPWNMARDGDQVLLWDWEHYEDDVLAGFDHLHYLAQTRRMRDGTDWRPRTPGWRRRAALTTDWGLTGPRPRPPSRLPAAINLRFLADRLGATEPAPPTARAGPGLLVEERPDGAPDEHRAPAGRALHVSEVTWGGVVTVVDHFTSEQVAPGHDVHLLAPTIYRPTSTRPGPARLVGTPRQARRLPEGGPRAAAGGPEVRPDVIHLHSFFAGLLGRRPAGLRGLDVPVVYQPHAWSDRLFTGPGRPGWCGWWSAPPADVRTGWWQLPGRARPGARDRVRVPGDMFGVALDLDHFRPPSDEERAGAGGRSASATSRGAGAGRIAWQKGQDQLLPAWEACRPEGIVL